MNLSKEQEPRIELASIEHRKWAKSKIIVTLDDGTTKELFSYYPDEISFSASELVGMSERDAHALFHKRDVEYLRS